MRQAFAVLLLLAGLSACGAPPPATAPEGVPAASSAIVEDEVSLEIAELI